MCKVIRSVSVYVYARQDKKEKQKQKEENSEREKKREKSEGGGEIVVAGRGIMTAAFVQGQRCLRQVDTTHRW